MAIVNHAKREINAKIVYYGPAGAGKTTSLRYVYDRLKPSLRGEFKVLPASGSSLLCFDFSPFEHPVFAGYRLRLHVYTLQGKVDHSAAWKMTLKGADGLMIVADMSESKCSLQQSVIQVRDFLGAYGIGLDTIPVVLQLNKTDLSEMIDVRSAAREAGVVEQAVSLTAAIKGEGVLEAVTSLSKLVMERIREREDLPQQKSADGALVAEIPPSGDSIVSADNFTPEKLADVKAYAGNLSVKIAQDLLSAEGNTIRIPLDLHWQGATQRVLVTVAVTSDQVKE